MASQQGSRSVRPYTDNLGTVGAEHSAGNATSHLLNQAQSFFNQAITYVSEFRQDWRNHNSGNFFWQLSEHWKSTPALGLSHCLCITTLPHSVPSLFLLLSPRWWNWPFAQVEKKKNLSCCNGTAFWLFWMQLSENPMQTEHSMLNDSHSTFSPGKNLRPALKVKRWKFL